MLWKLATNVHASPRILIPLIVLCTCASASYADPDADKEAPQEAATACVEAEKRVDDLLGQVYQSRGQCDLGKAMQKLYTQAHDELKRYCQGKPGLEETLNSYKEQAKTGKTMARMGC